MVVFKILSKVSGQNYIGSCRSGIDERWELYLRAAEAGLDFPLYKEIREYGEEQFIVEELDYADDIAELKEMELLHTVELSARSLRNYKFGITDAVVKRIRQVDHDRAWMKDLPEEPLRAKVPLAPAPKPKTRIQVAPPILPGSKTVSIKPESISTSQGVPLGSKPEADQAASETGRVDPAAELDKALFAEGIGLLVRAVAAVDQLSHCQQQARTETQALSRVLADSERVFQQLQAQQEEVALRARLAMEAVAASQSANALLIDMQRQTRECSLSALAALEHRGDTSIQAAQLQQELSRLLLRIKVGAGASRTAVTAAEPAPVVVASEPAAISIGSAPLQRQMDTPIAEVQLRVEAQEAKLVNQLKGLDQLLAQEQADSDSEQAGAYADSPSSDSPLEIRSPARAWVATTTGGADAALVLVKDAAPATVVLRRSKSLKPVSASLNGAAGKGRKTLSIKAR